MFKPSKHFLKSTILSAFAVSLLGLSAASAKLKKCDIPTDDIKWSVQSLANETGMAIQKLEREWAAQGKDLSVVILARDAKRKMDMFKVMEDRPYALVGSQCKPLQDKYEGNKLYKFLETVPRHQPISITEGRGKKKKQTTLDCSYTYFPGYDKNITFNEFEATSIYQEIRKQCKGSGEKGRCINGSIKNIIFPRAAGERKNMEFFHIGLAFKNHPETDKNAAGKWKVIHMLKPSCQPQEGPKLTEASCDGRKRESCIYKEKMKQFFLDKPRQWHSLILVPNQKIQEGLNRVVLDTDVYANFRSKKYNATAVAFHKKPNADKADQNSNQTILELIAAAQDAAITDRAGAQALLKQQGYAPSKLNLADSALYSFASSIFGKALTESLKVFGIDLRSTTSLKGHKLKSKGLVELVSVRSVRNYLEDNSFNGQPMLAQQVYVEVPEEGIFTPDDIFDIESLPENERRDLRRRLKKQKDGKANFK